MLRSLIEAAAPDYAGNAARRALGIDRGPPLVIAIDLPLVQASWGRGAKQVILSSEDFRVESAGDFLGHGFKLVVRDDAIELDGLAARAQATARRKDERGEA